MAKTMNLGKVAMTTAGNYDSSKNYERLTCVRHDYVSWVSRKDVPAGVVPGTSDEYWQKVSERGERGAQGPVGPQGNSAFDGDGVEIVNNLTQGGEAAVLSAEQGKILGSIVADFSEAKADVIVSSNNLIDTKNIAYPDSILDEWGVGHILEVKANSELSVFKVSVKPGATYTFGGKEDVRTYAFTDADMIIVLPNKYVDQSITQTVTAPIGAFYLWLSVYNTAFDQVQVNLGSVLLPYDKFALSVGKGNVDMLTPLRTEIKHMSDEIQEFANIKGDLESKIESVSESVQELDDIKENIESNIADADNSFTLTDDNDNVIVKVDEKGADFSRLCERGKRVVTEANIPVDNFIEEAGSIKDKIIITDDNDDVITSWSKEGVACKNLKNNGQYVQSIEDAISNDDALRRDLAPLCDFKISQNGDKQVLKLKDSKGGKYLLALHKKNKEGFGVENDIFLPSARKDFSDVRITANGETLSQKVLYCGNLDVLKVPSTSMLSGRIHSYNGVFYCGGINGGVYSSVDGYTWQELSAISNGLGRDTQVCLISSKGTMFIGYSGVLYKSSYPYTSKKEVLNENSIHPSSSITATSLAEDDKGNIFVGHYQGERDIILQKSVDDGETWNVCYRDNSGKYQHIHNVFYDKFNNTLYVGCDGGGGVLYSKNNGATFQDLRDEVPDLQQSTDYGVIYAELGFRLLSGETAIVGGHSLLKTVDDKQFKSVLACGKGCYGVHRIGRYLIAPMISSNNFNTSQILYSEDNGDSWSLLYTTSCHDDKGASDGFRNISVVGDRLYIISQGPSFPNVVVEQNDDSYYAEIMVDVPENVDTLEIETGYAMRKASKLTNDTAEENAIFYAPLNKEQGVYAKDGSYFDNLMMWDVTKGGRTVADIYPQITSVNDMQSVVIKDKAFYTGMLNLPDQFHIGFWMKSQQDSKQFTILKSSDLHIEIRSNYQLYINNSFYYAFNFPMVENCFIRVDINVARGQYVDMFVNGRQMARTSVAAPSFTLNNQYEMLKGDFEFAVQHFCISAGRVDASIAQVLYDGGLNDNY